MRFISRHVKHFKLYNYHLITINKSINPNNKYYHTFITTTIDITERLKYIVFQYIGIIS